MLLVSQKDQEGALRVVEEMIAKDSGNVDALMLQGRIYQSLDRLQDAKKAYERVIAADPKQGNTYVLLGKISAATSKVLRFPVLDTVVLLKEANELDQMMTEFEEEKHRLEGLSNEYTRLTGNVEVTRKRAPITAPTAAPIELSSQSESDKNRPTKQICRHSVSRLSKLQ